MNLIVILYTELFKIEISERKAEYNDKISPDAIYAAVSPLVSTSGENARTIKYKVQQVIEDLLIRRNTRKILDNCSKIILIDLVTFCKK